MLEKLKYVNHINEILEFGEGSLFVNSNDLRDFAWDITSKNDRISGFKKGIVKKTIPIILKCNSEKEGIKLRNQIFEVFEKDILAKKHGKFFIGDYYLRCFVTGSEKKEYLFNNEYMRLSLTVQTDFPQWVKEMTTVYSANSESTEDFLDFSYDFPFDFKSNIVSSEIINTSFIPSDFVINIFGYILNPTLYIAGHEYTVNVEVDTGDYLTINSVNKTIVLNKFNGERINCFNKRNWDSYIFKKIPAGTSIITSPNNQIYFDVTLFEERSEPKWT